uniref:Uncharacterized protein n=1 Tax=Romanomermis culicivorax TaxID=13658 RepID=A0A915HIN4_ROMCU
SRCHFQCFPARPDQGIRIYTDLSTKNSSDLKVHIIMGGELQQEIADLHMSQSENNKTRLLYKKGQQINDSGDDLCPRRNVGDFDNPGSGCSGHHGVGCREGEEGCSDYYSGHHTDSIANDTVCGHDSWHRPCGGMMRCTFGFESVKADWFRAKEWAAEP